MRFQFRQACYFPMWDDKMDAIWDDIDRKAQAGMCNKYETYRLNSAQVFGRSLDDALRGSNTIPVEINPGSEGIICDDRGIGSMARWGFTTPRFSKRDPAIAIKPAIWNNTRSENLHIPLWRESFATRRCLIPVARFAEAEGTRGNMTRTWYSVPRGQDGDGAHFSIAGIWRQEADGPVYSMIMTQSALPVSRIHDRMPVIIAPQHRENWVLGSREQASKLCVPWAGELVEDQTPERWYRPKGE